MWSRDGAKILGGLVRGGMRAKFSVVKLSVLYRVASSPELWKNTSSSNKTDMPPFSTNGDRARTSWRSPRRTPSPVRASSCPRTTTGYREHKDSESVSLRSDRKHVDAETIDQQWSTCHMSVLQRQHARARDVRRNARTARRTAASITSSFGACNYKIDLKRPALSRPNRLPTPLANSSHPSPPSSSSRWIKNASAWTVRPWCWRMYAPHSRTRVTTSARLHRHHKNSLYRPLPSFRPLCPIIKTPRTAGPFFHGARSPHPPAPP